MITAQIIYLCLLTLSLGIRTAETTSGNRSGKQFIMSLITYALQVVLLYMGGFFRWH